MRKRWRAVLLAGSLLGLGMTAWCGWQAQAVRADLTAAQTAGAALRPMAARGDLSAALAALPDLRARLDRAAGHTDGPVWVLAEHLPLVGGTMHATRSVALAAQTVGEQLLPEAAAALGLLRHDGLSTAGVVNLPAVAELQVHLVRAAQAAEQARALLAPGDHLLLPALQARMAQGQATIGQLRDALASASAGLRVVPALLGQTGPRRYFVAVQNNAESRATGGLIGVFALVTVDHGRIALERTGTDEELTRAASPVPSDPEAAASWQRIGSTTAWFDANLTPHFPDAARNLAGLWAAQHGEALDGVLALDPLVMSELLHVTGPVALADGTTVTQANVVDFVGHDEYVRYADVPTRKRLLGALAADLFTHLQHAPDTLATVRALGRAAASGHLLFWSAHPAEERALGDALLAGALPASDTPYLSVVTQNFGGDKLDFYLRRTVSLVRLPSGELRVTVVLRNTAPAGLPAYMTVRADRPDLPVPYGQARTHLAVYGARSSRISDVRVDGRPAPVAFDTDHGLVFGALTLELPTDRDVTLTAVLTEPAGELAYHQQPLVVPDTLRLDIPHRVLGR